MLIHALAFCLLFLAPQDETPVFHYFELEVEDQGRRLMVTGKPVRYLPVAYVEREALGISRETYSMLDGSIRALLTALAEADAQRLEEEENPKLVTYKITLAVRKPDGTLVDKDVQHINFDLGLIPGGFHVTAGDDVMEMSLQEITFEDGYREFLQDLIFPEPINLKRPRTPGYLVDLSFEVSYLIKEGVIELGLDRTTGSWSLISRLHGYSLSEQLGSLYVPASGKPASSVHLVRFAQGIETLAETMAADEPSQAALESVLAVFPMEQLPAEMLGKRLLAAGRSGEALRLLTRFQAAAQKQDKAAVMYRSAVDEVAAEQLNLIRRMESFRLLDSSPVKLVSPEDGDLIGGTAEVIFDPGPLGRKMLRAELEANGKAVASISGPPFRMSFKPNRRHRQVKLLLKTYFDDETRAENKLTVRAVELGSEDTIQLIRLRAVAVKGNKFLTGLRATEFSVLEDDNPRGIAFFSRDKAPLSIVVLMDTSRSMHGEKMFRAQHAVAGLLSSLEPGDEAAVFSFDDKVLRLTDFQDDFSQSKGILYTMSPRLGTSLYDALAAAHDTLLERSGTPVIIVVSDGKDSVSASDGQKVFQQIAASNTMVYSLFLGDATGIDREGFGFLNLLSSETGSITTQLANLRFLDRELARIYRELKSFYLIDFYSTMKPFDSSRFDLKLSSSGGKVRYLVMREFAHQTSY
ncbi:MAG: VWA domain-containing protein [Acidobacteriota bacterium]|nr:VWA domain-containing protein [Acidobacteriota bacterium]